jgi:hypothetical protein
VGESRKQAIERLQLAAQVPHTRGNQDVLLDRVGTRQGMEVIIIIKLTAGVLTKFKAI